MMMMWGGDGDDRKEEGQTCLPWLPSTCLGLSSLTSLSSWEKTFSCQAAAAPSPCDSCSWLGAGWLAARLLPKQKNSLLLYLNGSISL